MRFRKLLWFVIAAALFLFNSQLAHAHSADDLCVFPNLHTEDGCKPVVVALMMNVPIFHAAVKTYWHCRRPMVTEDTVQIAESVGAKYQMATLLKENYEEKLEETSVLTYWNRIPAHPEFDELDSGDVAKNILRVAGQTGACILGRAINAGVLYRARLDEAEMAARIAKRLAWADKYDLCIKKRRCR